MELIQKLSTENINNHWRSFGLFYCEYCNKKVKKLYFVGLKQRSCGCYKYKLLEKHRDCTKKKKGRSRLNIIWMNIKQRCYNKKSISYKYYDKRNIKVCKQWQDSYIIFKIWALCHGYRDNLVIDRINGNGNYEPNNCRWVTYTINNRNKNNVKLNSKKVNQIRSLYFNVRITQKLLSKIFNVSRGTIGNIIHNEIWIKLI